jgi:membrane protein DedA with SNARE-associated domain
VGPIAFVLVFLALPIGTALFLAGYTLATLAWRGLDGAPLAVWALIASCLGALFGLVIGRRISRTGSAGSPPW